jgi:hypothetical protein
MIIIKQLDRELNEKYYFHFCAYEGINEQKRSCCTKIILTITDLGMRGVSLLITSNH